jgi:hypothetical protein
MFIGVSIPFQIIGRSAARMWRIDFGSFTSRDEAHSELGTGDKPNCRAIRTGVTPAYEGSAAAMSGMVSRSHTMTVWSDMRAA